MGMKNLDNVNAKKQEILIRFSSAVKEQNEEQAAECLAEYGDFISKALTEDMAGTMRQIDNQILATRGCRVLTSAERDYYNEVIEAAESNDPKNAIANIDKAMPETIFESVFEDIKTAHPLLNMIDFENTTGLTKVMVNEQGEQLAVWGELTSALAAELSGALGVFNVSLMKLTAWMPISKDMLDLGPAWIDRYVREILIEACACAMEVAITTGTGKSEPIGMCKDVSASAAVVDGVYPDKETVKVDTLSAEEMGALCAQICVTSTGKTRVLENLILVVNPIDYYTLVMPATTHFIPTTATYVNDVLPVPAKIVQSAAIPRGKAIFGLAKRYFMGIGMSKDGKIEYDDSVKWLEDQRCYKIKTYGNGKPLDNNAFVYLNIEDLKREIRTVKAILEAEPEETEETEEP